VSERARRRLFPAAAAAPAAAATLLTTLALAIPPGSAAITAKPFLANGGRVAWYKGPAGHDRIAFDAVVDPATLSSEVYTINPYRSSPECVTCTAISRKGFIGQPTWHPDGVHLVIQVESPSSHHGYFNHMAWGFDNDLWIVARDGTGAERIWATPPGHTALHPQFSEDGLKLIFAERVPTSSSPQNPWDNWRIRVADVDLSRTGEDKLANVAAITPSGTGFYETHGFSPDGRIVYSHTDAGGGYVDDVYTANLDGTDPVNLLDSAASWDEFGHFSPLNGALAFISSRFDPGSGTPTSLRTELYAAPPGLAPQRVTYYNQTATDKFVVKDFDWDRTGTRIVYLLWGASLPSPQIWIISFP
jgi:Tol biopolymer transport system component